MNWRRGLLLAGVQLAVAVPLIVWSEAEIAEHIKTADHNTKSTEPVHADAGQEGTFFYFDPCKLHSSGEFELARIVRFANLPSATLIEWRTICADRWSLAGVLHLSNWPWSMVKERQVDSVLGLLIPIQWFLVGGFPLVQPRRWWLEPGVFITLCILGALILAMIPGIRWWSDFPILLAGFAWLYWFGLLVWKSLRSGWRLASRRTALNH
jgi:hypothetical protein